MSLWQQDKVGSLLLVVCFICRILYNILIRLYMLLARFLLRIYSPSFYLFIQSFRPHIAFFLDLDPYPTCIYLVHSPLLLLIVVLQLDYKNKM